ncbi:type VI secretion system tip protein TssI/VgrG, partial [Kosakonia sacchari]|uniref:type VI secretion system Vgr family protein n=1 Tax=Kosakonia sacchari TaxID=1158459 RepID=UPI0030BC0DB6
WPKTYGPQTAKVVGPQGESIWTDKYGRVKVKFHWDRLAKGDDTSSCWVRVSSAWAGQGFGGVQIPRVGDEVVIDFINGDPDRPIVTGRVYNESSMPPWTLPDDSTRMGFMTRSKDGSKDNASYLFFEDRAGSEAVELHSEKDMKVSVENDKTVNIDGNRTTTILKEQKDDVTGDASFHYRAKRTTTVDEAETTTFNNSQTETIKNGRTLNITSGGDKVTVKGGRNTDVEGTEYLHVTEKVTERFAQGLETTIVAGGKKETIGEGYKLTVQSNGSWQSINGGSTVYVDGDSYQEVSQKIHLKAQRIVFDAPLVEYTHKQEKSFWEEYFTYKHAAMTVKIADASLTGVSVGIKGLQYNQTGFDVSKKQGRTEFTSALKSAYASLCIMSAQMTMYL